MCCSNNEHLWEARFYERGSLAFWFCSRCGEISRETGSLLETLESASDDAAEVEVHSAEPPVSSRKWVLADGSILSEGDPCSVSFAGVRIPDLPAASEYTLTGSGGEIVRSYKAGRESASNHVGSFILTRFQVVETQLVKYRVHCSKNDTTDQPNVGNAVGIAIISDLEPIKA